MKDDSANRMALCTKSTTCYHSHRFSVEMSNHFEMSDDVMRALASGQVGCGGQDSRAEAIQV